MSFARGRFGIEYNEDGHGDPSPNLLLWALGVAFFAALVSLAYTAVSRMMAGGEGPEATAEAVDVPQERPEEPAPPEPAPQPAQPPDEPPPPLPAPSGEGDTMRRPPKLNNLLLRLEEAERHRNTAMAVSTIEQIRALPGDPAADISDALARRLGNLNLKWMFGGGPSPWTTDVVVKRGDNASRIAHEHGSTLASLRKLNKGDIDKLSIGQKLRVLELPRFNLVVRRRTRIADLQLNGKFFRRYYLVSEVSGAVGAYETTERLRQLLSDKGISLKPADRAELEMLVPKGSAVTIAEF